MKTLTILVTGGSGFIGGYVIDRLLRDGYAVMVLDHHSSRWEPRPRVTYFLGDIRDEVSVNEAMAHVDGFIHLAGVLGTQETMANPKPAMMTNITAGLNILEAAVQHGVPGVNIAVGNHWEHNPYSISKSTVEKLVWMYNKYRGANVSVVRALNAYGPRQSVAQPYGNSRVRKIMPSFIMRALYGDPIEVYGDGLQVMDMIYVSDVADFLVDALNHTMTWGHLDHAVEAGTGSNTTVLDIAQAVIREVGGGRIEHLPLRPGETPGAVVKAYLPTQAALYPQGKSLVSLEDGVRSAVEYYKREMNKR